MERCAEVIRVGGAMVTLGIQIDRATKLVHVADERTGIRDVTECRQLF